VKIKTSELSGPALDWAVAKAEGVPFTYRHIVPGEYYGREIVTQRKMSYSTNWVQGGPIIEREMLGVFPSESVSGKWCCRPRERDYPKFPFVYGPTALVAAMRCYVASRLGDEVDIPEELL
jgi:hypothetical protein